MTPQVLAALAEKEIESLIDKIAWAESERMRDEGRAQLKAIAGDWAGVLKYLGAAPPPAPPENAQAQITGEDCYRAYYEALAEPWVDFNEVYFDEQEAWVAVAKHANDPLAEREPQDLHCTFAEAMDLCDDDFDDLSGEEQAAWEAVAALARGAGQ